MLTSASSSQENKKIFFPTPHPPSTHTHMHTFSYSQGNHIQPLGSECKVLQSSEATDDVCCSGEKKKLPGTIISIGICLEVQPY